MDGAMVLVGWHERVESLYREDGDRLWRALETWAGDAEVANEATAEAFAQLLRRGEVVRDPAAWVWRTAFRVAGGVLKARRARPATLPSDDLHHDRYADPDLAAALRALPEAQRAAVVLFYYLDLPVDEIARRLGSNGLAVRANLSRGRRRLQQLLGDDDG